MPTPEKIKAVEDFSKQLEEHKNVIVTDYRGLTVEEMNDLRNQLREKGVIYQVVKNNLIKIALKNAQINGLDEYLFGPSAIAFSKDDPISPSKIIVDFAKKQEKLRVKGGYSDGKVINQSDIKAFSQLPSKEILLTRLVAGLMRPLNQLTNVVNGPIRKLAIALQEVSQQKKS